MLKWQQIGAGLLISAALMPFSAGAQNNPPSSGSAASPVANAAAKSATDDPNYIIGAQDVVDISVWKEPDLSRSVPVRPDGKISLPLLNDVQAAGLTPTQLASQITTSLNKFLTNPQVTVIVSNINSQRIFILGEVTKPGAYPLLPGMTILQGLSSAGGFTPFANVKKIYVLRQENGKQEKDFFNYRDVITGKQPGENIALRAGDTLVVP
jgi:polysaccharide export outer membrane protein